MIDSTYLTYNSSVEEFIITFKAFMIFYVFQYHIRFDHFSVSILNLFGPYRKFLLLTFFVIWYLHGKACEVRNTFTTEFISVVLGSVTITCGMFSQSFNIVWHTFKVGVTMSSFLLSKNANPIEKVIFLKATLTIFRSGSLYLLDLYVKSIIKTVGNVLINLM